MFDHLLESSHRDDSKKWSNIGFGQEIKELASIEIHFTHLIWRSEPPPHMLYLKHNTSFYIESILYYLEQKGEIQISKSF